MRLGRLLLLAGVLMLAPASAQAQWEVEVDPIAYGLDGFSFHVARVTSERNGRVQVGLFGATVPERWHGNDGLTQQERGLTVKADYFLRRGVGGVFLGVDGVYSRGRFQSNATGGSTTRNHVGLGPRLGYRFNVGDRLFITPWVSVSYAFNASDVDVSGKRFEQRPYVVFPTVHVGWRF